MPTPLQRKEFSDALSTICEILQEVWLRNEHKVLGIINGDPSTQDAIAAAEEVANVSIYCFKITDREVST